MAQKKSKLDNLEMEIKNYNQKDFVYPKKSESYSNVFQINNNELLVKYQLNSLFEKNNISIKLKDTIKFSKQNIKILKKMNKKCNIIDSIKKKYYQLFIDEILTLWRIRWYNVKLL